MDGNSGNLMDDLNDLLNTLKKNSEKSQSKINIKSEVNEVLGQSNDILNIVKTNPNIKKDN